MMTTFHWRGARLAISALETVDAKAKATKTFLDIFTEDRPGFDSPRFVASVGVSFKHPALASHAERWEQPYDNTPGAAQPTVEE